MNEVTDPELEERVTGGERHPVDVGHVPGADDVPPRVGIRPDPLDELRDLVDLPPVGRRPRTPLVAVDRTEIPALIRPLVPDRDSVVVEVLDVGVTGEKPQQLVNDRVVILIDRISAYCPVIEPACVIGGTFQSLHGEGPFVFRVSKPVDTDRDDVSPDIRR